MTLPENLLLPQHLKESTSFKTTDDKIRDLSFEVENMYSLLANTNNGFIKSSDEKVQQNWTPTIEGSTTPGTINYIIQSGFTQLTNNILDVWFHVSWASIGSGAGTLRLNIPYTTRKNTRSLWYGACVTDLTLPAGYSWYQIEAENGGSFLKFIRAGSGVSPQIATIAASKYVRGHVRCLIQDDR